MRPLLLIALFLLICSAIDAQADKKELDREAIKKMCGCYEVTFHFAETFHFSDDSLYRPSETKIEKGLEWAELVTDSENEIVLQHLLLVGNSTEPYIVKHWRQDWIYENTDLYTYYADNHWKYTNLHPSQVRGQWTQKVFQVDDSPRYAGSSSWVHVDGKSYWENTTGAPLPRREYTTRSDYNLTIRGNRHEITPNGWVHDQDNDKVLRVAGKEDVIIAKEKGYNTYTKVENSRCAAAAAWWEQEAAKWSIVRAKWSEVYARNTDLFLEEKVDNKVLFKYLFDDEYATDDKINAVIELFVKNATNQ